MWDTFECLCCEGGSIRCSEMFILGTTDRKKTTEPINICFNCSCVPLRLSPDLHLSLKKTMQFLPPHPLTPVTGSQLDLHHAEVKLPSRPLITLALPPPPSFSTSCTSV